MTNWDCDLFFGSIYPNLNLKQYLLAFEKFRPQANLIAFNILTFNDNDTCNCLEGNTSIPVYERFLSYDKHNNWRHVIINTKYDLGCFGTHNVILENRNHVPEEYTASGRKIFVEGKKLYDREVVILDNRDDKEFFLKHYQTKTIGEFLKQKYNRRFREANRKPPDLNYFFRQNKVTKEKIEYVKNKTGVDIMNDPRYSNIKMKYYSDNNIRIWK